MNRREAIKRAALMLGLAISPSLVRGVMAAPLEKAADSRKPANLNARQFAVITAAAERIIPRTDTPGATDVGVPAFIDLMCGEYLNEKEKASLFEAVIQLDRLSQVAHQKGFADLTPAQQDAVLLQLSKSDHAVERRAFQQLREITVLGFCTSQPIGTTVLGFNPVPGPYEGCVPLAELGNKAWYAR